MEQSDFDLLKFIFKAGENTYAGGGLYEKEPERDGFHELIYEEGDYFYRDSYIGFYRSWGTEVVRFQGKPIWNTLYGGGMVEGKEELARETFKFLKTCLTRKDSKSQLFRGPEFLRLGEWRYYYDQDGNVNYFHGHEHITYSKKKVFTHEIIGGKIISK